MTRLRVATHNQGDRAASPAKGYDVQCLTERSGHPAPTWAERYAPGIKGLAIDWNPDVLTVRKRRKFVVHPGAAKISPTRGTIWVTGHLTEAPRVKVAVVCSHRINDPDGSDRVGGAWRRIVWSSHSRFDAYLFRRLQKQGYLVFYGGDINERTTNLTPLVRLLRGHYDALGYTRDKRVRLAGEPVKSSGGGSDHGRYTATYEIKET